MVQAPPRIHNKEANNGFAWAARNPPRILNKEAKSMKKAQKRRAPVAVRVILSILLVLVLAVVLLFGFLAITEFKPDAEMAAAVSAPLTGDAAKEVRSGDTLSIVTWNIGYGALGDNADFFMDGGKGVKTADKARVTRNMNGIMGRLAELKPDFIFLQETDQNSTRSSHIDETELMRETFGGYESSFANNFKVAFLPYPVPPIGKVDSGIMTLSKYGITDSKRISLPCPFAWPVSMANLKRCLLVTRIPAENGRELVLVNLHLEAYDSGEGKIAQTKQLADFLAEEANKGNYVIAGGDFNQIFSDADGTKYPAQEGKWAAGEIDVTAFDDSLNCLMDETVPTCRSLDQPYIGADKVTFQYYLIDGFIVSNNVSVNDLHTLDEGFVCTDHNPVRIEFVLE